MRFRQDVDGSTDISNAIYLKFWCQNVFLLFVLFKRVPENI